MSFCPVCGAHHDPKMPCTDRAGELLRDAGIIPKTATTKELKETIKKANRSMFVLLIIVLSLFLLTILLSYFRPFRLDRQSAIAYINSGIWWSDKGDYDRAIADYNEAIESGQLSTEELAIAYYDRGRTWYDKEDYDKAIADFSEAIRLNPQFAAAYEYCGIILFNKGEFSSAAPDLAKSQQLKPDPYTAIWLYLARTRGNSDGKIELTLNTNSMDGKKWPGSVVRLYLGKADSNAVTSQAADPDLKKHKEQLCEANFFIGEWHLLHNKKQQAGMLFTKVQKDCPKDSYEYGGAVSELQRLK